MFVFIVVVVDVDAQVFGSSSRQSLFGRHFIEGLVGGHDAMEMLSPCVFVHVRGCVVLCVYLCQEDRN